MRITLLDFVCSNIFRNNVMSYFHNFRNPVRSNAIHPIEIPKMMAFLQRKGYKKAVLELEMVVGVPPDVSLYH